MSRPSSRQSPQAILHEGLASSARITHAIHSLIRNELTAMEAELKQPGIIPARRMELLRCICELGAELSRQTESIAKLITSKPTSGANETAGGVSEADIMNQILNGKRRV